MQRRSKYGNKPTEIDGYRFDSKAEARRYQALRLLERAGEITHLELQKPFKLHAGIVYKADFTYVEFASNALVAEDVKGKETDAFKIKEKLFRDCYPEWDLRVIPAREV